MKTKVKMKTIRNDLKKKKEKEKEMKTIRNDLKIWNWTEEIAI